MDVMLDELLVRAQLNERRQVCFEKGVLLHFVRQKTTSKNDPDRHSNQVH